MRAFELRRRHGDEAWRFEQEGNGWKRINLDLWCRHEEHQGWVIVDADG